MEFFIQKRVSGMLFKITFKNIISLFIVTYLAKNFYATLSNSLVSYETNFSLWEYLLSSKLFAVIFIGAVFISTLLIRLKPFKWADLEKEIRVLILICLLMLGWNFMMYDFNYFINSWGVFDRVMLLVFMIMAYISPYYIILPVIQSIVITQQFQYPDFFMFSFTDKKIIFDFVIITWIYIIIKQFVSKTIKDYNLLIAYVVVISSWYLLAGIGKHQIDWFEFNNLYKLYASTIDYGWLSFVNKNLQISIGRVINDYYKYISIATYFLEFLLPVVVLLFNRKTGVFCLLGFISFHLIVFLTSGIFFWKWILIESVMIYAFVKNDDLWRKDLRLSKTITYLLLLFSFGSYFIFTKLSWIDSGKYNKFEVVVKDTKGNTHKLYPSYFSPYDLNFSQNRFDFLFHHKTLTSTFGSTLDTGFSVLNEEKEIFNYIEKNGTDRYDEVKKSEFINFVKKYIQNKQRYHKKWIFDAPMHIIQGPDQSNKFFKEKIDSVFVIRKLQLIKDDLDIQTIDSEFIGFSIK